MANVETSERGDFLVVKTSSGSKSKLIRLLQSVEGVEILSVDEMEDLLFGEILKEAQRGEYVSEEEIARVLHEAKV